jgi:F0F1-type ATP synthase epsilon subunit
MEDAASVQPPTPRGQGMSKIEQGLIAVLITLCTAGVLGGIAAKTQIEVLATRVLVLERQEAERAQARGAADERERSTSDRLVRIESKVEATLDRLSRIEAEMRRERARGDR